MQCFEEEQKGLLARRCDAMYKFNIQQNTRDKCQWVSTECFTFTTLWEMRAIPLQMLRIYREWVTIFYHFWHVCSVSMFSCMAGNSCNLPLDLGLQHPAKHYVSEWNGMANGFALLHWPFWHRSCVKCHGCQCTNPPLPDSICNLQSSTYTYGQLTVG